MAQSVKHLPLTWVMIPLFWDGAPYLTLCSGGGLLLLLPLLFMFSLATLLENEILGRLGGSVVEHLLSVQGVIPGFWQSSPASGSLLEQEPGSPSACVSAPLSESLVNK